MAVWTPAPLFPSVASWDGSYKLQHSQPMFDRWAAPEFSTDRGTDLSPTVSFFDPISYHQGTVWPLYTGWAAVSEHRNGRTLSGYAHLMQNADLTWAQDPGAVRVALRPVLRALGAQHVSSTLVLGHGHLAGIARALRFGVECGGEQVDGHAQLAGRMGSSDPASRTARRWERRCGDHASRSDAVGAHSGRFRRKAWCLIREPREQNSGGVLRIPLPAVEAGLADALPNPGATTQQLKVLDQQSVGIRSC